MNSKEKTRQNISNLRLKLWKSKFFNFNNLPDNLLICLYTFFLFQNFCLNLEFSIHIKQHSTNFARNPIFSVINFIVGVYDLTENSNQTLYTVLALFFCLYFFIFTVLTCIIIYYISTGKEIPNLIRTLFSYFRFIHVCVFALPLNNYFFKMMFSFLENDVAGSELPLMLGLGIIIIFNWALTFLNIYSELSLVNLSILSRSTNYTLFASSLHAVVCGIYFGNMMKNSTLVEFNESWIVLDLILNLIEVGIFIYFVPFLNSSVSKVTIFFFTLKSALSLSNLLVIEFLNHTDFTFESAILLTLPTFIFAYKYASTILDDKYPASVLETKSLLIQNEYWLIRRIFYFMNLIETSEHKLDNLKRGYKMRNLMFYSNKDAVVTHTSPTQFSEEFSKRLHFLAESHITNPELKIGVIKILIDSNSNFFQNYGLIQKFINSVSDPVQGVAFMILKHQIEEKNFKLQLDTPESLTMKSYLDAIIYQEELTDMIEKFSAQQGKLYKLLQQHGPELISISNIVSGLMKSQTKIQEYWNIIPYSYYYMNLELMRLYAGFIKPFDDNLYKNLMMNYKMLRTRQVIKDQRNFDSRVVINVKTRYMLTSLEQNDFGKIIICSQNFAQVLKYQYQNMLGRNIKTILPFSYQQSLEKRIQKKVNDSHSTKTIEKNRVFFVNSEGYLKIFYEYSTILSIEHKGLCLWSILELEREPVEYLLVDENGNIESYTKGIHKDLAIDRLSRPTIKNLCEKSALRFDSIVKKTSEKTSFVLKPSQIAYNCQVNASENQNTFLIRAEKVKLSQLNDSDNESRDEMIPLEYSHSDIRVTLEGSPVLYPRKFTSETQPLTLNTHGSVLSPEKNPQFNRNYSVAPSGQALSKVSDKTKTSIEDILVTNSVESSQVNSSIRQSSVNSSQSYLEHKRVELKETLDSLKFFKFSEKYIPIIAAVIFVGVYLFVIMYSYITSTQLIDQVNDRVYIFNQVSGRARFTLEMCRNAHANLIYQDYWPNGKPNQISNARAMLARIKGLAGFNSLLRSALDKVHDEDMVNRFFEKRVKMFYDDFHDIITTDKYTVENSFTATNLLISMADVLNKIALEKSDYQLYVMDYLMTNSFNDLIQENENLFDYLVENVNTRLEKIVLEDEVFLIITIILLFCCIASTQIILYISYVKTSKYLIAFVEPGNVYLSNFIVDHGRTQTKDHSKLLPEKAKGKKNDNKTYKNPQTKKLFAAFMFKMVYILLFLAIPLGLLVKNHMTINETETRIRRTMKDLYNFNRIRIIGIYTINLQASVVGFPEGYSLYTKNRDNFLIQIKKLDQIISTEEDFSQEALEYLHTDICTYYLYHPVRPECKKMSSGIAHQGITPTMLATQTYYVKLDEGYKNANGNLTELAVFFFSPQYLDYFFLVSNGVNPAIEIFQTNMTEHLIRDLKDTSQVIISLFIAGAVTGCAIMIVILYTIWVLVGGDRKNIVQLVRLVPQEYLVRNREVKAYLIRQSDEATRYLKSIEKKMMQNE